MSHPSQLQRHCVTIAALHRASSRTLVVKLRLSRRHAFTYRPGQFVGLEAVDGRPRHFSIANATAVDDELELHVNRVPGGVFTGALFDVARIGDRLWMTGPFGDFAIPHDASSNVILVAGGTGFAPIKACLQQLAASGGQATRAMHFYWGVRTTADLYDLAGVDALAERLPHLRFVPVLDQAVPGDGARSGPVHRAVVDDFPDLSRYEIYACGAPPMIEALARDCAAERGFDPARLTADFFVTGEPGRDLAPAGLPLVLQLDEAGGRRPIPGVCGEALVQAMRRAGMPLQAVCGGKGACGTCRVRIAPDWRDRLPAPSRREARLLDFIGAEGGDRLSCQILLEASLGGLELSIPAQQGEAQ